MGLRINNLKYKQNKKNIFNNLNFNINNQEIVWIYFQNKLSQLYFIKLLLGKKNHIMEKFI